METQLSTIEEVQFSTQEQITALQTGVTQLNQDNMEVKMSLMKITEFLEKDLQKHQVSCQRGSTKLKPPGVFYK